MFHNFVLVSAVQHESAISIHIFPPSWVSVSPPSSQTSELPMLYSCFRLSVLHMAVYICQCCTLNSSHTFPPPLCSQIHSLHLHLYSHPANRFRNTIFLDSMCVCVNIGYTFSSFWLTSLCIADSKFIHITNDPVSLLFVAE